MGANATLPANWAFNAHIEALLAQGEFAIDAEQGFKALAQYWYELSTIAAGVPYSEIGFSKRREASFPQILSPNTSSPTLVGWDTIAYDKVEKGSIAFLKLRGVMNTDDGVSSRGVESLVEDLRTAYAHENIAAVLLDVSSPGGSSTAAAMLQGAVEERNKPVISLITGYAASGAYWGALPSDEIIGASNAVEIGSIGAYMVIDQKAFASYKERFTEIYADASPDKNKAFRDAIQGDLSGLKALVNQTAKDFHDVVNQFRALSGDRLDKQKTLSGGMFPALEAKTRGLIDGIGGLPYALERTAAWIKIYKNKKI